MVFAIAVTVAIGVVLADPDRRDHALAFADVDDAHAARCPACDADSVDRTADQRATIGYQHDLVARTHREGGNHLPAVGQAHQLDALAAATGDPILVGRAALSEAGRGGGE